MHLRPLLVGLLLLPSAALALPFAPEPAAPGVLEALDEKQRLLDSGDWLGRTPQGWLDWAQARLAPAPAAPREAPLGEAVRALYQAMDLAPGPQVLADLDARTEALDPATQAALGGLVQAIADVYPSQRAAAAQVDLEALRAGGQLLPSGAHASRQIHALEDAFDPLLAEQVRVALPREAAMASVANAEALLGAVEAFRAAVDGLPWKARVAGFQDPLGLVKLGGLGDDTFARDSILGDSVLIADLGGNDLDLTSAGGACPALPGLVGQFRCNTLAVSLRVDLGGDDTYAFADHHAPAQGSGALGGLGILVDVLGSDTYEVTQASVEDELMYYMAIGQQGSGEGGVGLLLDLAGNDRYSVTWTSPFEDVFSQSQGFAGLGGVGVILDALGDDVYDGKVTCTRAASHFCGYYNLGTALYPGVAIALDAQGNDLYRGEVDAAQMDYYGQSFAAFGGLGIQADLLGDDTYIDSGHSFQPFYTPTLNCAYSAAMYAGAFSYFLDVQGDDSYLSETIDDDRRARITSEGYALAGVSIYHDVSGDDTHVMRAISPQTPQIWGRAKIPPSTLEGKGAVYLDTGGRDVYADFPAALTVGCDGCTWLVGVDANLVPSV